MKWQPKGQWRTRPVKTRVLQIPLCVDDQTRQLGEEFASRLRDGVYTAARVMLASLRNRDHLPEKDLVWCEQVVRGIPGLKERLGFDHARLMRMVAFAAWRPLKAYWKRNKQWPETPPRPRRHLTIAYRDNVVKLVQEEEEGSPLRMQFRVHGRWLNVLTNIPERLLDRVSLLKKQLAGNLMLKRKWVFAAAIDIPYDWLYVPIVALGTDFNQTPCRFIVFDDESLLPIAHTAAIARAVERLAELNRRLPRPRKGEKDERVRPCQNTRQRRGVRRKIQVTHRKLNRLCRDLCEQIVALAISRQALLCIDALSCGSRTGSFGQDKVVSTLITMCEDLGVPFVVVPTYHTSTICQRCQQPGERPTRDRFECPHCGLIADADQNGAANTAAWGWRIWTEGLDRLKKWTAQFRGQTHKKKRQKTARQLARA